MATKRITLRGTTEWCKPWPNQIDREFAEEGDSRGGNNGTVLVLDDDSVALFNALGAKTKLADGNKITLRRYERHPVLGELGGVVVNGVPEGTLIGNGSQASCDVDVYDFNYNGRPGKAMRWVSVTVENLIQYVKPDSEPKVAVPF
jgi:hypothetical protein